MFGPIRFVTDSLLNVALGGSWDVLYVIENANWSIAADGYYLTKNLRRNAILQARTTTSTRFMRSKIVHFGDVHLAVERSYGYDYSGQKRVLTWFHVVPGSPENRVLVEQQELFPFIHTSCVNTRNKLIEMGIKPERICVIPLGVDAELFDGPDDRERTKDGLKIPDGAVVVGSFQKDGVGWGLGDEAKLIKGPDILVEVVKRLAQRYPVHVLLIGPARGYVMKNLRASGVPFTHIGYLKDYRGIAKYYRALDLYLITSRIEGGPKAILEAWASGVPVVSTRVGMVPDIGKDQETVLLADVGDVETLYRKSAQVIENRQLGSDLSRRGRMAMKSYSWDNIARQYYQRIYSKLL